MKLFAASLATETNAYSPIPTDLNSFRDTLWFEGGSHPDHPTLMTAPLWVARRRAQQEGWNLVEGLSAWAEPSAVVRRDAYEAMRDQILAELSAALPVDGVVLGLHGAMVADGYDDCEGDLLARMRAMVGPDVVIAAELDLHCHLTRAMTDAADILVIFKEYPHTDFVERGEEVVDLCLRTIRHQIRPVMSVHDCRMIGLHLTNRAPMRGFVESLFAAEREPGILSVSLAHGFPYADVPETGAKVLVVSDGEASRPAGEALATRLGHGFFALRGQTMPPLVAAGQAVDEALAAGGGPWVLADPTDNPGVGAPSDSTVLLRHLLERGIADAAVGPIWDPMAVAMCHAAGEGAELALRFGAKVAAASGQPVDARVRVIRATADARQSFGKARVAMGDAAAVEILPDGRTDDGAGSGGGPAVVLTSFRCQGFSPDLFTGMGVTLADRRVVVVKSTNHFSAAFAPIAKGIVYADSGGVVTYDHASLPYQRVPRPIWPLDPVN
ncbi:MAG: M81 family metallopeptidase [Alphaproteobacteria bacterium]